MLVLISGAAYTRKKYPPPRIPQHCTLIHVPEPKTENKNETVNKVTGEKGINRPSNANERGNLLGVYFKLFQV